MSASSVSAYETCHYRWRLEYIEGYPSIMGIGAAVGQAVHSGVEAFYKGVDNPYSTYASTFLFETLGMADPDEPVDKVFLQGKRALTVYLEDVGAVTKPLLVEYGFLLDINGILFSGHLDLADAEGKVRDTKVVKQKPRDPAARYGFSRVGYALGYRDHTGELETDFQLDVIVRLKRDRPRYVPISLGPVSDREIGVFAATLERTVEGITKGDFRPTGLGASCSWCPVKTACVYGQALEETRGSKET